MTEYGAQFFHWGVRTTLSLGTGAGDASAHLVTRHDASVDPAGGCRA